MGSLAGAYNRIAPEKRQNKAELIMAYEESYMKILKRYAEEISYIENMLKDLRNERADFYVNQLPLIRKELEADDVSDENKKRWIEEVQSNIEKSFKISESLIEHYVTKNLDEFKQELQEIMR